MTIDIGQTLGKYELRERVGQGGMAIVYRGLDTSLRREVAIKVLHRHLADSEEARDRFEREAQAVAKLRHENILEIFDFAGSETGESYIVTEFIEGRTLREFITEHEIRFPEVGAMIAVQVCRALVHAHALGVLHRDIKPENIMIRNDGVVKLTDFGIAQMLDLQRMTVTGQLLGSPAYMSPEHVEGKPLDFRTDVFAVGIVLYQLVTGSLPFSGKNPHEMLKRIAECRYEPPEARNPLVGKELGRIIKRALAREKEDRFADVSQMLHALERYLEGSGLTDHTGELARFFESSASYEMALRPRLISHLTARGKDLIADDRIAALEFFNRVLTLDPKNEQVLAELDKLSRRRRVTKAAALFGGLMLLGGGAFAASSLLGDRRAAAGDRPELAVREGTELAEVADAAPASATSVLSEPHDAGEAPAPADAAPRSGPHGASVEGGSLRRPADGGTARRRLQDPDAGPAVIPSRRFTLTVSPSQGSEFRLDDGAWVPIDPNAKGGMAIEVPVGRVKLSVRNEGCCQPRTEILDETLAGGPLSVSLHFLPALVVPECDVPGASARIGGAPARLGHPKPVVLKDTFGSESVTVVFYNDDDFYEEQTVLVSSKERKVVTCGR